MISRTDRGLGYCVPTSLAGGPCFPRLSSGAELRCAAGSACCRRRAAGVCRQNLAPIKGGLGQQRRQTRNSSPPAVLSSQKLHCYASDPTSSTHPIRLHDLFQRARSKSIPSPGSPFTILLLSTSHNRQDAYRSVVSAALLLADGDTPQACLALPQSLDQRPHHPRRLLRPRIPILNSTSS